MDDLIFQSSNQNSVYVLNSNYRYYGNFTRLNMVDPHAVISKNESQCQNSSPTRSAQRSFSAGTQPLQHKLRNFGKHRDIPKVIGNPVTASPSFLPTAASTTTTNPPATRCLAPTDAFQKFFNCSYVANVGACDNFHALHADCCSEEGVGVNIDGNRMPNTTRIKPNNNSNKKKSFNLKPSVIAKKTKFRKFIEEEKWRTADECIMENDHNVRDDCTASCTPTEFRTNSSVKESNAAESTTLTASMAAMATCGSFNNIVKNYWNGKVEANAADSGNKKHQQQNQSNNWSGSGDSNNRQQQTRQHLEVLKATQSQKTNYELYKEAAELLGLPCTLCDNCRCLECQSSYFDCDDSDSFSEESNSDEYDEDTMNVLNNSVELVMYANCYRDDTMIGNGISAIQQRQRQKAVRPFLEHRQSNFTCTNVNCNARELCTVARDSHNLAVSGGDETANCTERTDVINQNGLHSIQCNEGNELENCTSFNGLSLRDANAEMPLETGSERLA